MKKITIASALGIALASNIAIAKVELQVDDNIKVTAINGQEIRHGLLQPLQKTFSLEAGRHVITARYDRLFDISNSDHDYLKSDNITISADLADNQQYQLIMPNQPNNYNAAKEYAKAPTLAIAHNGSIIAQESTTQSRTGLLSGITGAIGNMFGRDNQAVNSNQQAIAAINQPPKTTNTANKDNLDGFMQLWLNASEEEREKIRQWIQK
ncbi:hypothetical protein SAMN02745664_101229 [Moraxella cuniculi DSM 21768]|uniref:DUF2057 domain-containing protein n=1 Tax=Moraxella cuniculi DSM 21768 TaxID=1122245 RepID=A0A1N7DFH1_9GAMM|nr:DUF2057 family protein [Moraxella cuniculi]OOS08026.1 hypothetical protein B0189_01430 [Moraxella cuniculi]SIR74593.1 hypothetical protein SAMN02745664_101229 [Moraxella cuniculi DSM 21768]